MDAADIVPELVKKYGSQVIIPYAVRRRNYEAYFTELLYPATPERKALLGELLDTLYSIRPWTLFLLDRDMPQQLGLVMGTEAKVNMGEYIKGKMSKFEKYYKESGGVYEHLRVVYTDCLTEEKAMTFIKARVADMEVSADMIQVLEEEYLKVWKADRLLFLYIGDLVEKFDGFQPVHMAEFLLYTNVPREKAIGPLLTNYQSRVSTNGLQFIGYLVTTDLRWTVQDLFQTAGIDEDEIELKGIKVKFVRDRTHKLEDVAKDKSLPENFRGVISQGISSGKLSNSNLIVTNSFYLYKDGKEMANISADGKVLSLNGDDKGGITTKDLVVIIALISRLIDLLAIKTLEKINKTNDQNKDAALSQDIDRIGLDSLREGSYDEALTIFRKALELDPNNKAASVDLGIAYCRQGKIDEGISIFKKVIETDPRYSEAYYNLGSAYFNQERYNEAIECYKKVAEINPNDPEAYYYIASSYLKQGNNDQAIANLKLAIRVRPGFASAYQNLGNIYFAMGDFPNAVESYRRLTEITPRDSLAFTALGIACLKYGKAEDAAASFKKAIEIDPNNKNAKDYLQLASAGQANPQAPSDNSGNDSFKAQGLAYFREGRFNEAIQSFKKAVEQHPDDAESYFELGNAYYSLSNYEEATVNYKKAIDLDPDNKSARDFLKLATESSKKSDEYSKGQ